MSLYFYLKDDTCVHCKRGNDVFSKNITHNLTTMADRAGIYKALWRPEENGFQYAKDIIPILEKGISDCWNTDCKQAFVFSDEGPKSNGANYCLFCGKELIEEPYCSDDDED